LKITITLSLLLASSGLLAQSRTLTFYHTHTGQSFETTYFDGRNYDPGAVESINRFLGDFRTGEQHRIDSTLLDLLHRIHVLTGSQRPFEVISAYRSEATNQMLRGRSENSGVARKSMHLLGRAIDVRLADVPLERLRDVALELQAGGVGYYPESNFVHIDTGPWRQW
jgi:uncharacterized protein YcbK (DUF882 family)